jgi:glucosamine kinase
VPFFLGIDGGGTKTRCLLGDDNSLLGAGTAGGCNVVRLGEACARNSLAAAIHEACVSAGISPQQVARTCAGVSGAGDDGVASLVQRLLIEIVGGAIEVLGDMEVTLEAAFGNSPGIIVIAGTGSIAYGRNSHGEKARAGGWGRVVSDEGAGHWIAIRALAAALRARDEARDSCLLSALMSALNARTAEDLVLKLNEDPVRDYASLFPLVLASAEANDPDAIEVIESAGNELANLADVLAKRLFGGDDEMSVATHGGVFANSARVKRAFERRLRQLSPRTKVISGEFDPARGALDRARREFGIWHRQ